MCDHRMIQLSGYNHKKLHAKNRIKLSCNNKIIHLLAYNGRIRQAIIKNNHKVTQVIAYYHGMDGGAVAASPPCP